MGLSDILFSNRCRLCNKRIIGASVCFACDFKLKSKINLRKRTLYADSATIDCFYLFDYDDVTVQKLLYSLKRNADKSLFEYAATLYGMCIPEGFDGVLSNTPRRCVNVRNFGYDQVKEPCRIAAQRHNLEFAKLVKRRGFSRDQKNLGFAQRQKNTHGKFRAVKKDIPENILLADDVLTTGSTFRECANVLLDKKPDTKITGIFLASSRRVSPSGK